MEEVARRFIERVMGCPLDECVPIPVTPGAAGEALWALAARLQDLCPPKGERGLTPVSEPALLAGLTSMTELGIDDAFRAMRPRLRAAVRARVGDLISVALLNESAGTPSVTVLPDGFPIEHRGLAILVLMAAELPGHLRSR
jgi:hypothetical protein